MKWPWKVAQEAIDSKLVQYADSRYKDKVDRLENENWRIQESLDRLELEIENEGYLKMAALSGVRFDRHRLASIVALATQMAIKNPIVNRTINVQADYVFGRGVRFICKNTVVQGWVNEFVQYRENRKVLTSNTALRHQERNHQMQGNLFFALFSNQETGRVIIRTLDFVEVEDIVRDPEDCQRSLYIRRRYHDGTKETVVYHPILWVTEKTGVQEPWKYDQSNNPQGTILWEAPVYVMQFNVFGKEKFALPEVYPQLDWALAYKRFLEDWTSIIRSFARMALKVTGLTGGKQAAATKSMLGTSVTVDNRIEKNPSGTPSRIPLLGKGVDIDAIKTSGATTPAKEGQPIMNMACAAVGLPNTFYGDASVGNYATAKTLDRPTEQKMIARQELWNEALSEILRYVIHCRAIKEFDKSELKDVFTNEMSDVPNYPADFDSGVEVAFPDILERNVTDRVRALANAVTLFGKQLTDIIPDKKLVSRLMMEALDIPDIDARLETFVDMWTKNQAVYGQLKPKPVDPLIIPPPPPGGKPAGAEDAAQGGAVGNNG